MTPLQRSTQRLMAGIQAQRGAGTAEQGQALAKTITHAANTQQCDARGGQFDGQGNAIELRADINDQRYVFFGQSEAQIGLARTLDKQPNGSRLFCFRERNLIGQRERCHPVELLAWQFQWLLTGRQYVQLRAPIQQIRDQGCDRSQQMLTIIEDDQQVPTRERPGQRSRRRASAERQVQRAGNRRHQLRAIRQSR